MEKINCPLCNSNQEKILFSRPDYTHQITDDAFNVVRCRKCGIVYVNPRPTEDEIHQYYPEEFYDININGEELLKTKQRQLLLKYQYISDLQPGVLLDVGCQKGEFMYFMQQKGWHVRGCDFSSKPPNVFGLDIFYGDFDLAGYSENSFDLITLWAVLEHVYNPEEMLKKLNRLLKPGGSIVMLVTNFYSLPASLMRHDDVPRHTTLFSKKTLAQMLKQAGYLPDFFRFNSELFGGTNRGVFNYLIKLLWGEKIENIVASNRRPERQHEFFAQLRGRDSIWMLIANRFDMAVYPFIDKLTDKLGFGFIMIAKATKKV